MSASSPGRGTWTTRGGTVTADGTQPGVYYALAAGRPLVGQASGSVDLWAVNRGVRAIQTALARTGQTLTIDGIFGPRTKTAVVAFQQTQGAVRVGAADGVVGPRTATWLFLAHVKLIQQLLAIPSNLLYGLLAHESSFDPGAVGANVVAPADRLLPENDLLRAGEPADLGIGQLNLYWNPVCTRDQAMQPFPTGEWPGTIRFAGNHLADALVHYKLVDAAICSYNSPVRAQAWDTTGAAPDERAASYVAAVWTQAKACPL